MIESTGNQLNINAINRNNRLKAAENKDAAQRKSSDVDADSFESSKSASSDRPASEPITSNQEAADLVALTGQQLLSDFNGATDAQGNLNPDAVLELIA